MNPYREENPRNQVILYVHSKTGIRWIVVQFTAEIFVPGNPAI